MPRRNDYRPKEDTFAWLDEREDWFFTEYLDRGALKHVIDALREQSDWPIARETIYAWLKNHDDRWERWNNARELSGHFDADEALDEARQATQQDANARRLKFEAKRWSAEVKNRQVYGKRPEVQLAIGVGDEWAKALAHALEPQTIRATPVQELPISEAHRSSVDSSDKLR